MDYYQQQASGNNPEYYYQQQAYANNPEYYYQQVQQQASLPQNYQYYNQYYNQYATEYPVVDYSAQVPVAAPVVEKSRLKSWFDFTDANYIKGLLVGAGIAVVLGQPVVRKALISGAVSTWDAVTCGFEELKEQVEDVRAEKTTETK